MPRAVEINIDGNATDILLGSDGDIGKEIRGWLGADPAQTIARNAYVHASGFIVLRAASITAADGLSQARLHFWPAGLDDPNPDKKVHKHGWNLSSRYLYGHGTDSRYVVRDAPDSPHGLYAVTSTALAGKSNLSFERLVTVEQSGQVVYEPGCINSVPPGAFHDTQARRGAAALTLCVTQVASEGTRSEVVVENSGSTHQIHVRRPQLAASEITLMCSALQRFIG